MDGDSDRAQNARNATDLGRANYLPQTNPPLPLGKIVSWLDKQTLQMMAEYHLAHSETERKQLCLKWRVASRLHPSYMFEPS
jgi:hypothetical protein